MFNIMVPGFKGVEPQLVGGPDVPNHDEVEPPPMVLHE